MMTELDDLKSIWRRGDGFTPKGESELASMLKGNSKSIVDKLKRSVLFEMIFTGVAGVGLLVYALMLESGSLKWTSVSILVLFVLYSFYYIKKLTLLRRFDAGKDNIKMSIETLIKNLTGYLKFYKRSYAVLYPIYFCLGLLFGGLERGTDGFLDVISKPDILIYLFGVGCIFFFCSTWLTGWYLKKLYGNYLEMLKGLLREVEGGDGMGSVVDGR